MEIHLVRSTNTRFYTNEIEQDHRNRHHVFVDQMGWEDLRRPDGLEIDEYDGPDTIRFMLLKEEAVVGGLRMTPLTKPNLSFDHFADMFERPLPGPKSDGADWTRFYTTGLRHERIGPSSKAAALYCGAMEFALAQEWTFLTFVSKPAMLEILLSIGWRVFPLGRPRVVDQDLCVAAFIEVSEQALISARALTGHSVSLLRDRRLPFSGEYLPPRSLGWAASVGASK